MERFKLLGIFTEKPAFWIAIAGAVLFKFSTTKNITLSYFIATTFSAVFFAVFFTGPILAIFNLPPGTYEPATAALVALFGEHVARLVLKSESIAELIRAWRGK